MRLFSKILKHVFFVMSVSSLVQAGPEDILEEFLARDAAISQRVISREVSAGDVRGERDGLIADINGRLAGEGYQLGWTQNFGIDRELSEAKGWKTHPGQGFVYDSESSIVSGKGFILSRTFDSSLFGDGPIIVGGSYSSINRESAFRLNVLQEKTFIGPVVTKGWNTQVFMVPVEGPEITVQFLNGAYQPLQVCAQILSAGILVPKEVDRLTVLCQLASRDDELITLPGDEPFTLMPQLLGGYQTLFWGVDQSDLYHPTGMVAPQYPLYHPYHPFLNVTKKDEIPQVPIAMPLLNYERMAPLALLKLLPEIKSHIIPFFVVQSLPYGEQTSVIARYQYGLFPDGKRMMRGTQAIFAQGIVYEGDKEFARFPSTTITIHESKKDEISPTVLSGNSMALSYAGELQGKGLWSLVLGSSTNALGSNGLFSTVTQAYIGYTFFLGDRQYDAFIRFARGKSPREFYDYLPTFLAGREGVRHLLKS